MNQKASDPGVADPDTDTDFHEEHSSEVIVAVRMAQQSQVKLNVLADQKANINIGFTLLFLSLTQSPMVTEVVADDVSRWGVVLVTILVSVSLILALLVVSPRVNRLRIQEPGQMSNPLYFGMFTQLDEDVYVDYMLENLRQDKEARRMMLVDVYQIGRVLKRKYQLLRLSYSFLALSALLFAMLFVYKTLNS